MDNLLVSHIKERVKLTDEEIEACGGYFIPRNLKKRQFFLHEGEISRYMGFVISGLIRVYTLDVRGTELIVQFAVKNWWVSDLSSFLSRKPAGYNIDAMADSKLLVIERDAREDLLERVPGMERYFRILLEANYVASHERIVDALSASAEDRYIKFTRAYPDFVEKIPQHQIASYLGITPQSLSRIRKDLSKKY